MRAMLVGAVLVLLGGCAAGAAPENAQAPQQRLHATVEPAGPPPGTVLVPPDKPRPGVPAIDPPSGGSGPVIGSVPADYRELPADRLDTTALPADYPRRAHVAPDGLSVRVLGLARDACAGVEGVVESADATSVRVRLAPMAAHQGGAADGPICAQVLTQRVVAVPLSSDLGARTLVLSADF
ncbi:hypothetical protein ACOBQX_25295 [Actinokineospora sp. G85]|uniref:hypothetical protein n=1 Tax=Actinokineospora sp. G85 TaxID=3406626 RepID=UPI003C771429